MGKPKRRQTKRKVRKNIQSGICHIQSTFNNTLVTITDVSGNVIAWSSSGCRGFKGSRKSTPFAAQLAGEDAARKAQEHGMRSLALRFNDRPTYRTYLHTGQQGSTPRRAASTTG